MTTVESISHESLGELVTRVPAAAKVLHRYGIDFCCGGKQSLEAACSDAGVRPVRVLAEITQAANDHPGEARWDRAHPSEIINHILKRYHEPLRRELPRLVGLARRTEQVHASHPSCPRGLTDLLLEAHEAVEQHLAKEEQVLFPMILAGEGWRTAGPIRVMLAEHEDHGANLARIRELCGGFELPEEACTTWRSLYLGLEELELDLMEHIHLENNVLFPKVLGT